jgi:hypothetical protein
MGRATEFFDYINRASDNFLDAEGEFVARYYSISITEDLKAFRKAYRKRTKGSKGHTLQDDNNADRH